MVAQNKYEHLRTNAYEYIKSYLVYDGSDRMQYVYEARANAQHGEPCLKTTYTYWTTSARIKQMKEEEATWDSSWDI